MYQINFDSDGLIIQQDGDGGDCLARSGTLIMGLRLREILGISNSDWPITPVQYWPIVVNNLILKDWTALRYNKSPYNNPKDVTGDQLLPIIMAADLMGMHGIAAGIANKNIHGFQYPNGDICGPADFMIAKGGKSVLGYVNLYGEAVVRCIQGRDPNNVGDDIRLTESLAYLNWRDGASSAAQRFYEKRRPGGVQEAWDWYFRPETNANPLNELWRPIIEKLFY